MPTWAAVLCGIAPTAIAIAAVSRASRRVLPVSLRLAAVALGALATVPASLFEAGLVPSLHLRRRWAHLSIHAVVAALPEELAKIGALGIISRRLESRSAFIYAAMLVGLGMSLVENLDYAINFASQRATVDRVRQARVAQRPRPRDLHRVVCRARQPQVIACGGASQGRRRAVRHCVALRIRLHRSRASDGC